MKTLDGVADDWPIDYDALTPFFEENDRMMGVSGLSGDPLSPLTHPPMPPQPLGLSGPLIGKAMNKLGWHWWPSDTTVATMDYEGRRAASISAIARRPARRAQKPRPTLPIGRTRSAPASSSRPIAACARS